MARLTVQELRALVTEALEREGVRPQAAGIVAEVTCAAELRGVSSHGVQMIPVYIERIRRGGLNPNAVPTVEKTGENLFVVDGGGGFGQEAARIAADVVTEGAESGAARFVAVRNTNHCGMLAYYTDHIAAWGAVGLMTSNTNPNVAAFGGAEKVLGTNPFSLAFPDRGHNLVIDMATTSIAKGKIYEYAAKGLPLPEGIALTAEGERTTDPVAALSGILLPFAGYKGYAISLAVEILSGVLTGAGFSGRVLSLHGAPGRQQNVGQLLAGFPISAFIGREEYFRRMAELSAAIKGGRLSDPAGEIYFPGDLEYLKQTEQCANGVEISETILAQLRKEDATCIK